MISLSEATRSLKDYDSTKTKTEIDEYIARGFGTKIEEIKPKQTIDKTLFFKVF